MRCLACEQLASIKVLRLLIDILIRESSTLIQYRPEGSSKPSSAIVSTRLSRSEVTESLSYATLGYDPDDIMNFIEIKENV